MGDRKMQKWRWVSYDVWGNEEDGFQVNDEFKSGSVFDIPEGASDEEIRDIVGLNPGFEFDDSADFGDGRIEVVESKNQRPDGRFEREEG